MGKQLREASRGNFSQSNRAVARHAIVPRLLQFLWKRAAQLSPKLSAAQSSLRLVSLCARLRQPLGLATRNQTLQQKVELAAPQHNLNCARNAFPACALHDHGRTLRAKKTRLRVQSALCRTLRRVQLSNELLHFSSPHPQSRFVGCASRLIICGCKRRGHVRVSVPKPFEAHL